MSRQLNMQCKVCLDASKPREVYSSHWVKDKNGKVVCPTLLSQKCAKCSKSRHTVKYCTATFTPPPKIAEKKEPAAAPKKSTNRFDSLMERDPLPVPKKAVVVDFPDLPSKKKPIGSAPYVPPIEGASYLKMAEKMPVIVAPAPAPAPAPVIVEMPTLERQTNKPRSWTDDDWVSDDEEEEDDEEEAEYEREMYYRYGYDMDGYDSC